MGLVNSISAVLLVDIRKSLGYLCESLIPRNTLELTRTLTPDSLERVK
jgi:hypothetical protein